MKKSPLSPKPVAFRKALLAWYKTAGRHHLPWRQKSTDYTVLVSEFMLQQTTVATVLPYFDKFLKAFPTIQRLAKAPLERVLELWSGLGYYARARHLHSAAQVIVAQYGGHLPKDRAAVLDLPGVGPYTAGALLSFSYNHPEPLVDGNVTRVLARVYGVKENVVLPAAQTAIWSLATALVPRDGARDFNSALMDLGATVCRPQKPDCLLCPLMKMCWARGHGAQETLPRIEKTVKVETIHIATALIEKDGQWLLRQRPAGGLYAHMWEFPHVEQNGTAWQVALEEEIGIGFQGATELPEIIHKLTHRTLRIRPYLCTYKGKTVAAAPLNLRWFSAAAIGGLAISSWTRHLSAHLPSEIAAP